MDAVQKVGNGHPGTAMSMAPTAYLLFQKWLRHDPSDPQWTGRDRFVLSMGHSSLTLYVQLYLSGYGLELADLQALRTWGSLTPGHPEVNHTPGVETTTGPLGQGVGNAVGMAMAARRERGLFDPETPEGESLFDHTVWAFASDGDLEEGVSGEASSHRRHAAAGQPRARLRRQQDLDRGQHRDRLHRGRRQALRGLRLARPARGRRGGPRRRWTPRSPPPRPRPSRPSIIVLRTVIGWPAPNKQNTGAAHGSALGDDEVKATKEILGFDPEQTFEVTDEVIGHARKVVERGQAAHAEWEKGFQAWEQANPEGAALLARMRPARCPRAGRRSSRAGTPTRRAWPPARPPARCSPRSTPSSPSCGAARPTWPRATTPPSRASRRSCPANRQTKTWPAAPTAAPCTSASGSTPWARS